MNSNNNSGDSHKGFAFLFAKVRPILVAIILILALIIVLFESCVMVAYADTTTTTVRNVIYHTHTGSSGSGGGCFSISRTGTRTIEEPCGGTLYYWGDGWGTSECDRCGASYFGNRGGQSCPHGESRTETYTYYELGCGKSPSTVLGYVNYTRDTTEWAKEVHVTVTIEDYGLGLGSNPYVMNGSGYPSGEFTLTENGTYNFGVSGNSNAATGPAGYTVNITNIDHTPPSINDYTLLPSEWVKEGVLLELTDVTDPQPDNTPGCGLHQYPYSYDDGETWEDSPSHFYEDNGDYHVLVRDALENTTRLDYTIDNIDHEAPNIVSIDYDKSKNLKNLTVTVTCNDILADGREGSGLADAPYSYDGGKTWTASNTYFVNHNIVIDFRVKDKLGNENGQIVTIDNIDDYMPTVSHALYPGYWTNGDVEVSFTVYDRNPDGSDGIGLPNDCFSYDSGKTWTSENTIVMSDNGNVHVAVRDKNENTNYYSFDLINIDRNPPVINASLTLSEDGRMAILMADGSDAESGIDYGGFTWVGPEGSYLGMQIAVMKNGVYTVTGRDKAGNTATATVSVADIKENILDRILPDNNGDNKNGGDDTNGKAGGADGLDVMKNITVDKLFKQTNSPKKEEAKSLDDLDTRTWGEKLWDAIKHWWENLSDFEKFMIGVAAICLLIALLLLIFLFVRSVSVYSMVEEDKYNLLGWRHISNDDGKYIIKLPDSMIDRAESIGFRFKFKWLFVVLHKDREVYFKLPQGRMNSAEVARYVDMDIR